MSRSNWNLHSQVAHTVEWLRISARLQEHLFANGLEVLVGFLHDDVIITSCREDQQERCITLVEEFLCLE